MDSNTTKPVLYFDGVCNLCNGLVTFIIRQDKKEQFLFAPLQSAAGVAALQHAPDAHEKTGSFILLYNNVYYTRSSAALHTFRLLGGGWQLLYAFIIVPRFIRDAVYRLVSRNRYKWFGQKAECMVPTPELMARFVNS
jgi:predicted DCC family thiol-disulfide oxidoreductase YuxK